MLEDLYQNIPALFTDKQKRDLGEYSCLKYPRLLPFLQMKVKSYQIPDFGYLMCMNTSMLGIMKLSTFALTPSAGVSIPFLLIDTMSMGKKRLAYVELYDCRKEKIKLSSLEKLEDKYAFVENYQEKPAWYVQERMKGSLIKYATQQQEKILYDMVIDALQTYITEMKKADKNPENLVELKAFAHRMVKEGNPSSKTLNKVLGENKALEFFYKVIMPLE